LSHASCQFAIATAIIIGVRHLAAAARTRTRTRKSSAHKFATRSFYFENKLILNTFANNLP